MNKYIVIKNTSTITTNENFDIQNFERFKINLQLKKEIYQT